jgi:hypothetical protein
LSATVPSARQPVTRLASSTTSTPAGVVCDVDPHPVTTSANKPADTIPRLFISESPSRSFVRPGRFVAVEHGDNTSLAVRERLGKEY